MNSEQEQIGERVLAQAAAIFAARSDNGATELLRAVERLEFAQTEDGYTTSSNWNDYYWAAVLYIDAVDIPSFDDEVVEHLLPTIIEVAAQNDRPAVNQILVRPALRAPDANWRQALEGGQEPRLFQPQDTRPGDGKPTRLTEVTRMRLFDTLRLQHTEWAGRLEEAEFLKRIFNLDAFESYDSRFQTAEGDIYQHRVNNDDWEPDWVFTDERFGLRRGPDAVLLRFLSEMLHPVVRTDEGEVQKLLEFFNSLLARDGYALMPVDSISGYTVYGGKRIPVQARPMVPTKRPLVRASAPKGTANLYDLVRAQARGERRDYRLDRLPNEEGGQAQIFRAIHKPTDVEVAFKRRNSQRDTPAARMRREIEISQLLGQHAHYMPILDSNPVDGWLVMPMAQATAEQRRDSLGDPVQLRALVEALMDVLELAHAHDWLHRDVKPSNILLLDNRWTLADWGIVRRPRGQTTQAGRTRFELGTEGFAAPELFVAAHEATAAADIYGIGRVIAWALTGQYPQMNVPLSPPPGPWRNITRLATHADPRQRVQSIQDLRELINRELTEPAEPPSEQAKRLLERTRAGDPAAVGSLLELVADHPEDYDLYVRALVSLSAEQAGPWLSRDPQASGRLFKAMSDHVDGQGTRRVQFVDAARVAMWLHAIANFAAAKDDWDLLEEAARTMCTWDATWDQWSAQDRIAPWLRSLSGQAAQLLAAVLRDHPRSARHFSGLAQDGTVDLGIRVAIQAAAVTS
ncbi:serine/threonine protein kinase [Streptomyces solincola]|uniref:non-specific serine/threonine protein kinase n=1 Tax=Streptomyces solincola TaxID=2100817 RepID=A0A2S9Q0T2_9ACTN|nr:serine/threonine protein kinase [Streptomyces solincola]PRH80290.1 serine/threonine protein kinase [Streptomyces solincola]